MKKIYILLFLTCSFVVNSQVLTLNGTALTASGGAPSNCTAGGYKTLNSANLSGNCVTFTTGAFQNGAIWAFEDSIMSTFKFLFFAAIIAFATSLSVKKAIAR